MRPPAEADKLAQQAMTSQPAEPDPEIWYYQGAIFAYCGKKDAAMRMFRLATGQNYCGHSNLLSDPLVSSLQSQKEFDKVLTAASECQQALASN